MKILSWIFVALGTSSIIADRINTLDLTEGRALIAGWPYHDVWSRASMESAFNARNEWISVDDRLPEVKVDLLVWAGYPAIGFLATDGHWWDDMGENKITYVTHWMPLPEPPK